MEIGIELTLPHLLLQPFDAFFTHTHPECSHVQGERREVKDEPKISRQVRPASRFGASRLELNGLSHNFR